MDSLSVSEAQVAADHKSFQGDTGLRPFDRSSFGKVCGIGTPLFHVAESVNALRGWGRDLRNAVGRWYLEPEADKLAYQVVKYQQRDSWSHGELLCLAQPKARSAEHEVSTRSGSDSVRC